MTTIRPQQPPSSLEKPRYIMIGGFLGAGKTTAVAKLAARLTNLGRRVGLITNDQGRNLVDTLAPCPRICHRGNPRRLLLLPFRFARGSRGKTSP